MKIVVKLGQYWPILPNISTTTEPIFTNVSAFVDVYMYINKLFRSSPRDVAMVNN